MGGGYLLRRLVGLGFAAALFGGFFEARRDQFLDIADLFLNVLKQNACLGGLGAALPGESLGLLDLDRRMLALDFLANPSAQELDRMFTHTASSLAAKPVGSHERRHPCKGCMPHSSRVGLDRQDVLPVGQGILPMVRGAEGMEGFEVHVQIIENDGIGGRDRWKAAVVVFACFFLTLTAHSYHKPYRGFPVDAAPTSA